MLDSCGQMGLAERAFYKLPRGKESVTGPTVHLARELARCFRNIQYGVSELRRDDAAEQSEMQAFAWDVQANTRCAAIFIVPHKRDRRGRDPERLVDMQAIYESNANAGARRLRECILDVLPIWFVEDAKKACHQTLVDGGGVALATRITNAVDAFRGKGVTVDQLEQRLRQPTGRWTAQDVAQLTVIYTSLDRGEIRAEEEFPQERITAAEIVGKTTAPATTPAAAKAAPTLDPNDPELNAHWAPQDAEPTQ
jgi:hypothetical protein